MSQKKVDAYKKAKVNRKADAKKEKRNKKLGKVLFIAIIVAVILGIGVALFFTFKDTLATNILNITYSNNEVTQMNVQNTSVLILILPLILLFIITQRFFVEGVERSGLTG